MHLSVKSLKNGSLSFCDTPHVCLLKAIWCHARYQPLSDAAPRRVRKKTCVLGVFLKARFPIFEDCSHELALCFLHWQIQQQTCSRRCQEQQPTVPAAAAAAAAAAEKRRRSERGNPPAAAHSALLQKDGRRQQQVEWDLKRRVYEGKSLLR
jgi:hypothetical protein